MVGMMLSYFLGVLGTLDGSAESFTAREGKQALIVLFWERIGWIMSSDLQNELDGVPAQPSLPCLPSSAFATSMPRGQTRGAMYDPHGPSLSLTGSSTATTPRSTIDRLCSWESILMKRCTPGLQVGV